ncbi:MAG TPA: 3,4-dihydroxy-2-butanone-4-phosphate synthase [Kofleriaceae bacterium]|nr:3,4-dihydroxy-2-butanone-4-phosphate synthase [Kofleriaceae bacterium]
MPQKHTTPTARVTAALDAIRAGQMVIMVDDEDRENEGDFVLAAEKVSPEAINFMAKYGRGLICLAMDGSMIDRLELPMMVRENQASLGTAFTVSIEARHGVSTGISAKDRYTTIAAAIADDARPQDLVSPGHVFPLRARKGGVLVRTGQTEGSVDLARLAGFKPAGVICEIMRDDGEMARMPELEKVADEHGLVICSVADLIAYRLEREHIVRRKSEGGLRPGWLGPGEPFRAYLYDTEVEDTEYLALVRGEPAKATGPVLVRVAAHDPVVDPFAARPDVESAMRAIDEAGCGVFLYVHARGRSSLAKSFEKLVGGRAGTGPGAQRPDQSSEALRDFGLGAQVLADLGLSQIRLMSNNERRIVGIEGFGIRVVERVPIPSRGGKRAPAVDVG